MKIFLIVFLIITQLSTASFAVDDSNFESDSNFVTSYDSWSKSSTDAYKFGKESSIGSRLIVSLVLVGGLGVAAYFLTKKLGPKIAAVSGKNIKIVEITSIGNQRHIAVIECYGRKFLIGASGQSISLISELDKKQEQV